MWRSPRVASASGETLVGSYATLPSVMVSTPQSVKRSSPLLVPLFVLIDSDCLNDLFRLRPGEVDRQQPVLQIRAQHLHPLRQHESALEVARGNAAMDVLTGLVVLLAAPDHELVFLNVYIELVTGKARHRQRDSQPFGSAVRAFTPLDIVGRVTVGALDDAVEHTLDLVKAQKKRTGERRNTRHSLQSPLEATLTFQGPNGTPCATIWALPACVQALAKHLGKRRKRLLTAYKSTRLRPPATNRCSFSRGARTWIASPIAGPC